MRYDSEDVRRLGDLVTEKFAHPGEHFHFASVEFDPGEDYQTQLRCVAGCEDLLRSIHPGRLVLYDIREAINDVRATERVSFVGSGCEGDMPYVAIAMDLKGPRIDEIQPIVAVIPGLRSKPE